MDFSLIVGCCREEINPDLDLDNVRLDLPGIGSREAGRKEGFANRVPRKTGRDFGLLRSLSTA